MFVGTLLPSVFLQKEHVLTSHKQDCLSSPGTTSKIDAECGIIYCQIKIKLVIKESRAICLAARSSGALLPGANAQLWQINIPVYNTVRLCAHLHGLTKGKGKFGRVLRSAET